jgi:hypothetical protein
MDIALAFIEKYVVDSKIEENFVLTTYVNVSPNYKAGDTLFLQITNHEDESKSKRTREYKIVDVIHSIRETTSRNNKSLINPLGIVVHMGMEVYVREVNE